MDWKYQYCSDGNTSHINLQIQRDPSKIPAPIFLQMGKLILKIHVEMQRTQISQIILDDEV